MTFAAEGGTGGNGDARLVQQAAAEGSRVGTRFVEAGSHVRERVEGAGRRRADDSRHAFQFPEHDLPAARAGRDERRRLGRLLCQDRLRPGHREGGCVRGHMALDGRRGRDHLGRTEQVAHPPAGHGVALREGTDQHHRVRVAGGQRSDAGVPAAVVHEALVGLVGDQERAPLGAGRSQALEIEDGGDGAGGVARRVDDHRPRPLRHRRDKRLRPDGESVLRRHRHGDGFGPRESHLGRNTDPGRGVHDSLVAGRKESPGKLVEGRLRAHRDQRVGGAPRRALGTVAIGQQGSQLGRALQHRILRPALVESPLRSPHGCPGRGKVGLSGTQIEDLDSLTAKLGYPPGNRHRGRLALTGRHEAES